MAKLNNLVVRSISGLVFMFLIVGSLLWFPHYVFKVIFGAAMSICLMEFYNLTNKQEGLNLRKISWLVPFLFFMQFNLNPYIPIFYFSYIIFVFIEELFRKTENPLHNLAYFVLGQVYIAFPFFVLNYIYLTGDAIFVLAMFMGLWANDVGAYVVGSMIGKHKLFERISPKKTWEGFFGGMFFAMLLAFALSHYIPQLSLVQWVVFMLLVVVFGTLGDLVESMIKRTVDVKDSGNIMPGHGGLLDRFDSMLLLSPIVLMFLFVIFH